MALDYSELDLNDYLFSKDSPLLGGTADYSTFQATEISRGAFKTQVDVGRGTGGAFVRIDGLNRRIVINDGTANRLLMGNNGGTMQVKLSQAGNNVLTAADNNLIWSSEFNSFKIVQTGTVVVPAIATGTVDGTATGTVTHNLGYRPSVIAFWDSGTISGPFGEGDEVSAQNGTSITGLVFIHEEMDIGTSTVEFSVRRNDLGNSPPSISTSSGTVRYYLSRETALP